MKTDWHRYNLKRRVASLPSVDAVIYAEKVQQSKQFQEETDEFGFKVMRPKEKRLDISKPHGRGRAAEVVHQKVQRELSPASITSELSHLSMGESVYSHPATHTDFESNFETGSERTMESDEDYTDEEEVETDDDDDFDDNDDYEEEPLQPITSCIYCGIPHREIEQNVSHMFKSHGLYIPERSYLVDLKGLLEYLISVIVIDNECLCCNFQGKNLESIRAHVTSKGHCRLPYESKEERALFSKFYDFSSADEVAPKSKSNKSVGFNEDSMQVSDEGDDSEGNGVNNNYTLATIDPDISALNLPNGSRLGHRSLQRIYRQHTPTQRESVESQLTVISSDKRLGGLTSMEYKKEVIQPKIIEQRDQNKFLRKETKKRINFQSHFRDQMLGG
jgi:pre-60S factor REI1